MLESLVDYYEYLLEHHPERVASPGWSPTRVAAFIELDRDGNFIGVIPAGEKRGDEREVPKPVERSVNVAANLLCDNSSYIFGIDEKGKPERSLECFAKSKELHMEALSKVDSTLAQAVVKFFETWDPAVAPDNRLIERYKEDVLKGRNLVFMVDGVEVLDDVAVRELVSSRAFKENGDEFVSLVSGKTQSIARLHPKIKLPGGQSSGGVLVGFNAPSFTSYGHDDDQGLNSPIGEYEAFAYTTALNYLISQPDHHIRIEDTTIVYWALEDDDACAQVFQEMVMARPFPTGDDAKTSTSESTRVSQDARLDEIMSAVRQGKVVDKAKVDAPFFVMGISPNAARVSVRFFLADSFGQMLDNIAKHYERLRIVRAPHTTGYLSVNRLVWETQNPKAKWGKSSNILASSLLHSILTDTPYPAMLFQQALMRTRTTQDDEDAHVRKVDYGRASIIKAYLIKNCGYTEEELMVSSESKKNSTAYNLGRLFAVLERAQIQAAGDRTLNTTIVDRYFNSACATPGIVFPVIMKLGMAHLTKLRKTKQDGYLAKLMGDLLECIGEECGSFPARLTIEEQGEFIIGYWCQRQEFFKGNNKQDEEG